MSKVKVDLSIQQKKEIKRIADTLRLPVETTAFLIIHQWMQMAEGDPYDAFSEMAIAEFQHRNGEQLTFKKDWVA